MIRTLLVISSKLKHVVTLPSTYYKTTAESNELAAMKFVCRATHARRVIWSCVCDYPIFYQKRPLIGNDNICSIVWCHFDDLE